MITFLYFFTIFLFLLLCVLTCGVVLVQESKSTGLGASFGGDSTDSLFGTSTADVLKTFTAWLGGIFLVACVILSFWTTAMGKTKQSSQPIIENVEQL